MNSTALFAIENAGDFRILKSVCDRFDFRSLYDIVGRRRGRRIVVDIYRNPAVDVNPPFGTLYVVSGGADSEVIFAAMVFDDRDDAKELISKANKLFCDITGDGEEQHCLRFDRIGSLFALFAKEFGIEAEYPENIDYIVPNALGVLRMLMFVLLALSFSEFKGKVILRPYAAESCSGFELFFAVSNDSEYGMIKECTLELNSNADVTFIKNESICALRVYCRIDDPSLIGMKCQLTAEEDDESELEAYMKFLAKRGVLLPQ